MSKHTEWTFARDFDGDYAVFEGDTPIAVSYDDSAEDERRVRLMAAAPELLKALEAMYDGCPECGSAMCDHQGLKDCYAMALGAIIKAKGGDALGGQGTL